MKVRYSYLDRQFADIEPILDDIRALVRSGDFTLGEPVRRFEASFAALVGARHAIGVGSGTDALFLILTALGVGPNDEVITAANTFVATAGAIAATGARVVFVDCDEGSVIDPARIERAIGPRTKALLPVHWAGRPADLKTILEIGERHRLPVVEDACQAIGAAQGPLRAGSAGVAAAFSLHPLKNLNVWGDGGVVTTNSSELCETVRLLRDHGLAARDTCSRYGYNSRLDALQAVVGNHLIPAVEAVTAARIRNAARLDAALAPLAPAITLPRRVAGERHVYHLYQLFCRDRDALLGFLRAKEVGAKIHYPVPLHLQPASRHLGYRAGDFPVAEAQARTTLTLPVHQHLADEEIAYMIACVREFCSAS